MAMLAEKKRRQKWCLNPRGKQWSDDQTKYGQRILEKMGWSAGQGLGINKQGPTEIVKVKKKDDSAGLGFKENGEKWLETTNEYSELLDQLASTEKSEQDQLDVSSSLEDRSKKSKARVHYHKFTRGKDLSRYSDQDLASIIGPDLVKFKPVDAINADYKANQINKGSSTEYFNGKKKAKRHHSPEPDPTINEETTNNEEQSEFSDKKHNKIKISRDDGNTLETKYDLKKCSKKNKKQKHNEEQEAVYQFHDNKDLNNKKLFKKKNKCLQDGIEIERIEHINQLEDVNNGLCTGIESEDIFKANRKVNKIKTESSIEPEVDNFTGNPCEEQKEDAHCEKLPKDKKKKTLTNGVVKTMITNEVLNASNLETNKNVKLIPFECENNCDESNKSSKKDAKKKKKVKEYKSEVPIALGEDSNVSCSECPEGNLTYQLSANNIQRLKDNCSLPSTGFGDKSTAKEENVVYKKKKKNMEHNVQANDYVEKPETVENETIKKKISKKRKAENKDKTIDDPENNGIRKKKAKEENIEGLTDNKLNSVLNSELSEEPPSEIQLPKHTKKRNKSKHQSAIDTEENVNLEASEKDFGISNKIEKKVSNEKLPYVNKENKFHCERTSNDNNEDTTSKATNEYLTVFGRKTRLNKLNITRNPARQNKFDTEEFMAFSENQNISSTENTICENPKNSKNSLCHRIYVEPNNEDSNISMNVTNYEYRLLTSKIKQLNIPTGDVKIAIKNNTSLQKKLHKKLKLLYKSKYYKSLLPADELADIEASVEQFAAKLQPRIDVIKGLLEIENQTIKLANEISDDCGMLPNSNNKQIDQDNVTPEKKETLKEMKNQLKLLSKIGKETIKATSRNNEELTDKKRTKMTTPNSKNDNKNGKVSSGGLCKEVSAPIDSLQTRIEERLKVLGEQMSQLAEGRKLLTDKKNSSYNEGKSSSSRWESGSRERWANTRNQVSTFTRSSHLDDGTKNVPSAGSTYGRSQRGASFRDQGMRSSWGMGFGLRQGALRGQMWGREKGTVSRGRISKNNFDAKQYAKKCQFSNKLPEISFKGVDLKVISGYAANNSEKPAIESSSHKTNS